MILGTAGVIALAQISSISWLWHGLFAASVAYASGYAISLFTNTNERKSTVVLPS
jgi:hypothetical protein